jgi:hypothetical protein
MKPFISTLISLYRLKIKQEKGNHRWMQINADVWCLRRQKVGGRRQKGTNWEGIETPPNLEPPNRRFAYRLDTLTPLSHGQRAKAFPLPPAFCPLPLSVTLRAF